MDRLLTLESVTIPRLLSFKDGEHETPLGDKPRDL